MAIDKKYVLYLCKAESEDGLVFPSQTGQLTAIPYGRNYICGPIKDGDIFLFYSLCGKERMVLQTKVVGNKLMIETKFGIIEGNLEKSELSYIGEFDDLWDVPLYRIGLDSDKLESLCVEHGFLLTGFA